MSLIERIKSRPVVGNVAGAVFGIIFFLFFIYGIYSAASWVVHRERHKDLYGEESREYRMIGDGVGVATKAGDRTVRTVGTDTRKPLSPWFLWIADKPKEKDSLIVFCDLAGKRGFLNARSGKVTIKGRWAHAWNFSEGLAAVVTEKGRLGFVDPSGQYAIPPEFFFKDNMDFVFKNGFCPVPDGEGRLGIIDRTGKWVIEPSFSQVDTHEEGAWVVQQDELYGLLDKSMKWLYPPIYEQISIQDDRKRLVSVTENGVKQLRTYEGDILIPFGCDYVYALDTDPMEDGDMTPILFVIDGHMGLIDSHTGEVLLPALYDDIDSICGMDAPIVYCKFFEGSTYRVLFDYKKKQFLPL